MPVPSAFHAAVEGYSSLRLAFGEDPALDITGELGPWADVVVSRGGRRLAAFRITPEPSNLPFTQATEAFVFFPGSETAPPALRGVRVFGSTIAPLHPGQGGALVCQGLGMVVVPEGARLVLIPIGEMEPLRTAEELLREQQGRQAPESDPLDEVSDDGRRESVCIYCYRPHHVAAHQWGQPVKCPACGERYEAGTPTVYDQYRTVDPGPHPVRRRGSWARTP